jgi:rhamnose transport system permease protein
MTPATDAAARPYAAKAAFPYWHESGLALVLLIGIGVAGLLQPRFVRPSIQVDLAGDAWTMALVALPMAMIVIAGGIDLSVGSITGLCAVVLGLCVEGGLNIWAAVAVAMGTGALAGLFNALLIARIQIHPLIVTLATMAGFRGIALALTRGRTIQGFPEELGKAVQSSVWGLPLPMWGFALAATAAALFLSRSAYGRFLYAMGHNETAARYSGVPVTHIKLALYTLSGISAAVGSVLLAARYGQAKADFATGLELAVITAVVLGGVSIFGGRGNVGGLLIGLALLHECNKFISWHWHVSELNDLVTGGLLVGSVLLNSIVMNRKR